MQFSPATIEPLILIPLREFFRSQGKESTLFWDEDEKKSKMQISAQFDANRLENEQKPRIVVNRGGFAVQKSGLSDSMASAPSNAQKADGDKGLSDRSNFVLYSGSASIVIEARNRGVCELMTDMVTHFLVWSRPFLCEHGGFKDFAMPLQVSDCSAGREATEKHTVTIQVPYMKEERWRVQETGVILKGFFYNLESKMAAELDRSLQD